MDVSEATQHLARIRKIMESATELTVLPGKAAIAGGVLALAGCGLTYHLTGSLDFGALDTIGRAVRVQVIGVWAVVAVVAVAFDILMTLRVAAGSGRTPWPRLAQMASYAMGPGIFAGTVLTIALAMRRQWQIVPGVWMMIYGCAVWTASVMSVRVPRSLGWFFLATGVLALFWAAPIGLLMVGIAFGLGHIVCGIYLLTRFGD